MKYYLNSLIVLILLLGSLTAATQNYSPGLVPPSITECPLTFPGGTGIGTVGFVNIDSLPMANPVTGAADPTVIIITVQDMLPQGGAAAISGSGAAYFNWIWNPTLNSFQGTQNQDIPALASGPINIAFDVTSPSPDPLNPTIGFAADLTPPNYATGSNEPGDDFQEVYCHTEDPITCSADNGTLSFGN